MSTVILCCNTLENELGRVLAESGLDYPVIWLEAGLHNQPVRLRERIAEILMEPGDSISQSGINASGSQFIAQGADLTAAETTAINTRPQPGCGAESRMAFKPDRVLMALGYCGGAVSRLGPFDFEMIMPRADDCLSILMGSMELRRLASGRSATYFLTEGWLRHTENLITSFTHDQEHFGRERAERIYKIMLKHYRRFGFIDTTSYNVETAMEQTRPLADLIGIKNERLPGSLKWLRKLVTGPWDEEDFVIIPSGRVLSDDDWGWLAGTVLQNI